MNDLNFRKLQADELMIKPTDTKFKGSATLLIYKDARVDMRVLDSTVGQMGWQKDYKEMDGKIYCGVGIYDTDKSQWIWKWDTGSEGNFESEKSLASDAFKRACFNWGVGRELYQTPKIKIKCPDSYYYNDKLNMSFSVQNIEWNNDTLVNLTIVDKFNNVVYDYKGNTQTIYQPTAINTPTEANVETLEFDMDEPQQSNMDKLTAFCSGLKNNPSTDMDELKRFYNYYSAKADKWDGVFNVRALYDKWINGKNNRG